MPNWCMNELTVSGNAERVGEVLALFQGEEPFQAILPRPEEEEANWYTWNISHWGTKWDISNVEIISDDEYSDIRCLCMRFDTAWSPPEGIFDRLQIDYPDLDFSLFYREDGVQLAGYL